MAMSAESWSVTAGAADAMVPRIGRVRNRRRESGSVWTLDIELEMHDVRFQPGQFNMLTAFGVGEIPVSLSSDPAKQQRLAHTIRAVGATSRALVEMRRGDAIGVRGPFGNGWPVAEARGRDVIVMAGGLGVAPLRPLLHVLAAERSRYGRVAVLYGTRSPDDVLFRRELERWRRRFDMNVHITVDHARSNWHGEVGVVTSLLARVPIEPGRAIAFVCGPEVMMRASMTALSATGMPDEAIHLSIERNMKCALAWCGRCQLGTVLVCRDGPVFRRDAVRSLLAHREM